MDSYGFNECPFLSSCGRQEIFLLYSVQSSVCVEGGHSQSEPLFGDLWGVQERERDKAMKILCFRSH